MNENQGSASSWQRQANVEPSLPNVVLVCLRHRRLILGVAAGALVASLAWLVLSPPTYRAEAKVLIRSNRAEVSSSAEQSTGFTQGTRITPEEMNSQLELAKSPRLVSSVLEELPVPAERKQRRGLKAWLATPLRFLAARLPKPAASREQEAELARQERVLALLDQIDVRVIDRSNVIELAYEGPDPLWARDFVNRLTTSYVQRHAHLQQLTEAEEFFNRQSAVLRDKVAASEDTLNRFRDSMNAFPGRHEIVRERLAEFTAELARTEIARVEQERLVAFLEQRKVADRGRARVATPELLALEAKRAEVLSRYQKGSARVQEVEEELGELRRAVSSYDSFSMLPSSGTDLLSAQAKLESLRGKEEALTEGVAQFREEVQLSEAQSFELTRLTRQLKLDEEAYLSYVRSAEESRLTNALQQSELLALRVIEPATLPLRPASPVASRVLPLGLVGGVLLGIAAAIAREQFDNTIKTAGDVRRYASLDVLAVLPERA